GADPRLERDADRPEDRRADPGPPPRRQGRDGRADRGPVRTVDPEESVTMADAKTKAPAKKGGGPPPAGKGGTGAAPKGAPKVAGGDPAPKVSEGTPRLLAYCQSTIRPRLAKEFGIDNPHRIPRLV